MPCDPCAGAVRRCFGVRFASRHGGLRAGRGCTPGSDIAVLLLLIASRQPCGSSVPTKFRTFSLAVLGRPPSDVIIAATGGLTLCFVSLRLDRRQVPGSIASEEAGT